MKSAYKCTDVAEKLKSEFDKRGLKPTPTMKAIGLGENTLRNFQTSMPKADTLAVIADYLDVSVDYLLGRSPRVVAVSAPVEDQDTAFMMHLFSMLDKEKRGWIIAQAQMYLASDTDKEKAAALV